MRQFKFAIVLLAATALAGCGGSKSGDQSTKVKFSSQVNFGDSLSDVGTYSVGAVAALGGGKYTINNVVNGVNLSKNWSELMAAQLGLSAPCSAQTGLAGYSQAILAAALSPLASLSTLGFSVTPVTHAGCTSYAQGGARVTNPVGPGNKLMNPTSSNAVLGQLTVPVVTQIANHLATTGGSFSGSEIVFVLAGANDVFAQLQKLSDDATTAGGTQYLTTLVGLLAAGSTTPSTAAVVIQTAMVTELANPAHTSTTVTTAMVTAAAGVGFNPAGANAAIASATSAGAAAGAAYASGAGATAAVTAMGQAGVELAGYVTTQILAKGAKYVTVINMPDVSVTPFAVAAGASTQALISSMVTTFNTQLQANLTASSSLLYVDVYTAARDQVANPIPYGLTNVTASACDPSPAKNFMAPTPGYSLVCNSTNLIPGVTDHYMFADPVHPTPFAYSLFAGFVSKSMIVKGWL